MNPLCSRPGCSRRRFSSCGGNSCGRTHSTDTAFAASMGPSSSFQSQKVPPRCQPHGPKVTHCGELIRNGDTVASAYCGCDAHQDTVLASCLMATSRLAAGPSGLAPAVRSRSIWSDPPQSEVGFSGTLAASRSFFMLWQLELSHASALAPDKSPTWHVLAIVSSSFS